MKNASNSSSSNKSIEKVYQVNQGNQTLSQVDCDENILTKNKDTKKLTSTYNSKTKTTNLRNLSDGFDSDSSKKTNKQEKAIQMTKTQINETLNNKNRIDNNERGSNNSNLSNGSNGSQGSNSEKINSCERCKILKKEIELLKEESKKLKIELKQLKVQALNESNERNKLKAIITTHLNKIESSNSQLYTQKAEIDKLVNINKEINVKYNDLVKYSEFLNNEIIKNKKDNKDRNNIRNENPDFSSSNININDYEPITLNDTINGDFLNPNNNHHHNEVKINNELKVNLGGHIFLDFAERCPLDINTGNLKENRNEQDYYDNIKTTINKDLSIFNDEYSVDDFIRNKLDL